MIYRRPLRRVLLASALLSLPVGCSFQAQISTKSADDAAQAEAAAAAAQAEATETATETATTAADAATTTATTTSEAATAAAETATSTTTVETDPTEPPKANVTVVGKKLTPPGAILFAPDTAYLLPGSGSELVLAEVRKYLEQTARVTRLRIEGHTHNQRAEADALELSGQRARTVKLWLIGQGIDANRLVAVGFGQAQPEASNADAAGQAQNERIAFRIAELDGKPYLSSDLLAGGKEFP